MTLIVIRWLCLREENAENARFQKTDDIITLHVYTRQIMRESLPYIPKKKENRPVQRFASLGPGGSLSSSHSVEFRDGNPKAGFAEGSLRGVFSVGPGCVPLAKESVGTSEDSSRRDKEDNDWAERKALEIDR